MGQLQQVRVLGPLVRKRLATRGVTYSRNTSTTGGDMEGCSPKTKVPPLRKHRTRGSHNCFLKGLSCFDSLVDFSPFRGRHAGWEQNGVAAQPPFRGEIIMSMIRMSRR